jgi:DNA-directed RNA polymerase subunit M/transcription elongation factor TFIIS
MIHILGLHDTREKVYDNLLVFLQNVDIVRALEKGIVDYTSNHMKQHYVNQELAWNNKTTRRIYLRKYRSIMFNIEAIKIHLQEGIIPGSIPCMKYYDINPEVWKEMLDTVKKREIASLVAYNDTICDGLLTCYECKSKRTRYTSMQTRSGDEPTTIYAHCSDCGFAWTE